MNVLCLQPLGAIFLAAGLLFAPVLATAEIVTTDQIAAQRGTDAERAKIEAFLDRASVADQLQALGVDALNAKKRLSALSDDEVHELAGKIDSLPAGGNIGGFTDQQIIIILLLLILVVILVS